MPDLNYCDPAVTAELQKVVRFWLNDVGVDGFRLDAAKHYIEDSSVTENTPETHAWYQDLRAYYKGLNPQAMTVGEVWSDSSTVSTYLAGDELDLAFDFDLAKAAVYSAGLGWANDVADVLAHDVHQFRRGSSAPSSPTTIKIG